MTYKQIKRLATGYILLIEEETRKSNGIPNGDLFAAVAMAEPRIDLYVHNAIIDFLVSNGAVKSTDGLLTWVGPASGFEDTTTSTAE